MCVVVFVCLFFPDLSTLFVVFSISQYVDPFKQQLDPHAADPSANKPFKRGLYIEVVQLLLLHLAKIVTKSKQFGNSETSKATLLCGSRLVCHVNYWHSTTFQGRHLSSSQGWTHKARRNGSGGRWPQKQQLCPFQNSSTRLVSISLPSLQLV